MCLAYKGLAFLIYKIILETSIRSGYVDFIDEIIRQDKAHCGKDPGNQLAEVRFSLLQSKQ